MKAFLKISERKNDRAIVEEIQVGTCFHFPEALSSTEIPDMDDFGGIFRLRVQPLEAAPKGRSYTTTIDGHVTINRSDREVVILRENDLYFSLSSDRGKYRALKNCHAGDFFSSDDTVNRTALWMVCSIGTEKTYVNIATGEEKYFDEDEKLMTWTGDAVTWVFKV